MAASAYYYQIREVVVKTVMVFMMYIHVFFSFFADKTYVRKVRKSNFSIPSLTMFKLTILASSWLRFIATNERAKLFFKMSGSRFCKRKIFSTKLTLSSDLRLKFDRFISTFSRTTKGFAFRKAQYWDRKFFATQTSHFDLFFLKFIRTAQRTKKIFILFRFPKLGFKNVIAKCALYFHIQHDISREVLC